MTAFLQQYISPALPVILWLFRGVTAGLAVWLLVRCCKSLFRGRDRESWGFVTLSNGARYELYHWENVIGRARRADIRVNFPSVSRTHAILQRDDGGIWRVDPINRSSGVLLNGKRTLVPASLNPGDSIALGGVELFFFPSEQPQHTGQPKKRPSPVGSLWLLTFIQLLLWGQFAPGFGAENIYPVSAGFFGLCGLGWALYGVSRRLHRRQFDLETLALLLATVGFAITAAWDPGALYKQLAAVALLGGGERTQNEMEAHGITKAVLDNLCAKGVLECSKVNKSIDLYSSIPLKNEPITLTAEQQAAYDALLPGLEDTAPHSALLYGVTGSGKTLVFLKLIERCLALGRRALVLVPEISLTPQMILRLKGQFGRRVAVQHSALNHTERLLQWQMIQDGGADIVVGTRSAVFAPLENIGLVIIDEEQEHTYRSESAPRYAAHEVARQRAAENGSLLLLASATPSTESFYAAQNGRTQLVRLTQRYGGNPLPSVQIVDMRAELASGNPREISLAMEDAIRRNLDAGKQTILLLNRRGYQTMAQCDDCREVLKCPKCSVPMVYHKAGHKLLCHYCGTQLDPPPKTCPACGGKLLYRGFGTQKAEEELAQLFPEARVLRMDQDSTAAKDAHEKLLAKFARHEYDIMVGTQMVAKGLDFEDVTLVGVLGIDSLLFAQGFRAYETVFSLITQVVGRSGRAKDPGFAIIQTTDPDNPVLNLAAAQDYDAFFEQEIAYRKLGLYPPFCGLCVVGFSGPKEIEVARAAARFSALLGRQAAQQPDLPLRVLGPTPGNIEKINENYRYKLTIKCRADKRFRDLVRQTLGLYEQEKLPSKATVVVDMHSDGDI